MVIVQITDILTAHIPPRQFDDQPLIEHEKRLDSMLKSFPFHEAIINGFLLVCFFFVLFVALIIRVIIQFIHRWEAIKTNVLWPTVIMNGPNEMNDGQLQCRWVKEWMRIVSKWDGRTDGRTSWMDKWLDIWRWPQRIKIKQNINISQTNGFSHKNPTQTHTFRKIFSPTSP